MASVLALVAVVPWGDAQDHSHWVRVGWIPFISPPIRSRDVIQNLMLFAPVGGFAAYAFRRSLPSVFVISLMLSVTGEWTQIYSHNRFPSATDVTCNVVGALTAGAIVRRLRIKPSGRRD